MKRTYDIKRLRAEMGWRQDQMAEYLGLDRTSISHLENGREPSGPVKRLLDKLIDEQAVA